MPTYQYACTECGHAFDEVQSFSDEALTECPECDGRLRKVFNAVGVVFKGSGFYRNDSRPQKAESGSSPESGSSNGSSGSESGKGSDKGKESGGAKKSADTSSGSSSSSAPAPA